MRRRMVVGVRLSRPALPPLCPYTESRAESEVLLLKGEDSRELLEPREAGQGGLAGAELVCPAPSSLVLLSGFWAISEKYCGAGCYTKD